MRTSEAGRAFITRFEGCVLYTYDDADKTRPRKFIRNGDAFVGVLTIGVGHTRGVKPGTQITPADADALLATDLRGAEIIVEKHVKAALAQHEFDALVSFAFNIGEGNFERSSVVRKINFGDKLIAATKFELFDKQRLNGVLTPVLGLRKRRIAERELFLHGDYNGKP